MKLEPVIEMPCMISAVWRRFALHVFEGKVDVEDMRRIEVEGEKWHAKITGKLVEMVVIRPSDAKMTSEEREHMARIIRRWESSRVASATVILAQGLVGSMHRSVLTGLQFLAPAPHPVKVFAGIGDATKWLAPFVTEICASAATSEALGSAIDDVMARFDARTVKAPGTRR